MKSIKSYLTIWGVFQIFAFHRNLVFKFTKLNSLNYDKARIPGSSRKAI